MTKPKLTGRWVLAALLCLGALAGAPAARAHPATVTGAALKAGPDGRLELRLRFNALAFLINDAPQKIPDAAFRDALNAAPADLEAMLADARERMRRGLSVSCDGAPVALDLVEFPDAAGIRQQANPLATVLLEAAAQGQLPPGSHRVGLRFPEVIGDVVVSVAQPGREDAVELVAAGERSPAFDISVSDAGRGPAHPGLESFRQFVTLGFRHILPEGLDHILFVLGLFLLSTRARNLLAQVTAFTVAHSITLGLSLYGVFRLPPAIVEPLIAVSIALVAWDNLRSSAVRPGRLLLVFGFGLVHGLGFAGALRDLQLERSQFATALVGFNCGIELGQLAVIGLAFLAVGWARKSAGYRRFVIVPASAAIGLVALGWTIQRIL